MLVYLIISYWLLAIKAADNKSTKPFQVPDFYCLRNSCFSFRPSGNTQTTFYRNLKVMLIHFHRDRALLFPLTNRLCIAPTLPGERSCCTPAIVLRNWHHQGFQPLPPPLLSQLATLPFLSDPPPPNPSPLSPTSYLYSYHAASSPLQQALVATLGLQWPCLLVVTCSR